MKEIYKPVEWEQLIKRKEDLLIESLETKRQKIDKRHYLKHQEEIRRKRREKYAQTKI